MRDRFGIFGTVTRFRQLSLLLVMMLRIPNSELTQESQEQRAAAEGYKVEVARLEALLAEKDLALNQAQADLSTAQSEVARWHRSSTENEKRAEGKD